MKIEMINLVELITQSLLKELEFPIILNEGLNQVSDNVNLYSKSELSIDQLELLGKHVTDGEIQVFLNNSTSEKVLSLIEELCSEKHLTSKSVIKDNKISLKIDY